MSELIPTGVTFGTGRKTINNTFSGEAQFNTLSAVTYYSGSTNISDLFVSSLDIKTSSVSAATYSLNRVLIGGFKFFAQVTLPNVTHDSLTADIPIVPLNYENKNYFKLNTLLVSYLNRDNSGGNPYPGTISFNNLLNTGATRMEITLAGDKNGQYNYIEDTAIDLTVPSDTALGSPEYGQGSSPMPNIASEAILMNHTGGTPYSGSIDVVIVFEGMLI